jgi:hypothetical protein
MSAEARLSPKDRRVILEQLSRDRLGELSTRFQLDVADRRSSDAHVDAIVRKRSLDFREVLEHLRREELQAACEALGLETGGREKAKLIDRILGEAISPAKAEVSSPLDGSAARPAEARSTPSSAPPPPSVRSDGTLKSAQ